MYFETSPQASPSKPITISAMSSPSGSVFGSSPSSTSSRGSTCAYPSWPTGKSLNAFSNYSSAPSAFISDADLFGDYSDEDSGTMTPPLLEEAPAPPRQLPLGQAFPLLPLYASEKPKSKRRRSSGRKQRRPSKPMTPISESPEAPE